MTSTVTVADRQSAKPRREVPPARTESDGSRRRTPTEGGDRIVQDLSQRRSRFLYFAPKGQAYEALWKGGSPAFDPRKTGAEQWLQTGDESVPVEVIRDVEDVARCTRRQYYDGFIIDCRLLAGSDHQQSKMALRACLDSLTGERDREHRYPFDRITVLVGDANERRVDRLIFELGQRHVGACLRDYSLSAAASGSAPDPGAAREQFLKALGRRCQAILAPKNGSKKAMCAAGGGIPGIYYELGALKCLADAFRNFGMVDFNAYFGISAGAIVSSLLASGFTIDELLTALDGQPDRDISLKIGLRDVNVADFPYRAAAAAKDLWSYAGQVARRRETLCLSALFERFSYLVGPMFATESLESSFRKLLEERRQTNSFHELDCELYIGATDEDRREHALFGDGDLRDVPITRAVQASAAIHPYFRSVSIDGRRYTDGFSTRTSNLQAAVERDAKLIIVLDPFLPLISDEPGFNARRGLFWGVVQDYKTLCHTRFDQVSEAILAQNPDVTCYAFYPGKRMRRLMTSNPVGTNAFHSIVSEAYCSTYRRLRQVEYRLVPELAQHGIDVSLDKAANKVERIAQRKRPNAGLLLDA